jgi:type IV pilus assembly protein PilM
MALSFQRSLTKKRSQVVAVDMGSRTTKAVQVKRHGHGFELTGFYIQDSPPLEKTPTAESISKILKELLPRFESKPKSVVLIIGSTDSLLRPVELPTVPVADMRLMLRYNSKNYLQQDLSDHVFDCHILPNRPGAEKPEAGKPPKSRTLVGGAKKSLIDACQEGAKSAGVQLEQIVPNLVGNSNAFELAQPELFSQGSVALVDIGFKSSSICILDNTELGLNRVVGIGGDHLTRGLMEAMSISYEEAERLKCEGSEEVQPFLSMLLAPLGRELRASIDFFEKQEDKTISEVFVSGGSALQPFIIESLQSELMVACKTWNPTSFLTLGLPPQQLGDIERIAPLLAVATGVAVAAF